MENDDGPTGLEVRRYVCLVGMWVTVGLLIGMQLHHLFLKPKMTMMENLHYWFPYNLGLMILFIIAMIGLLISNYEKE